MDSTFPEQIIQKEGLYPIFKKLSFRVLSTNYSIKDLFDTGERDVQRFVTEGFFKDNLSSDMKILEIGCGVGRLSRSFSDSFKDVYAVDIDKEMVEMAQTLNNDRSNLHFLQVDGSTITSFEDNFFDYVFSYYVFQHIRDMEKIISYFNEIRRVLKPEGLFQIQVRGKLPGFFKNIIPVRLYNLALKKQWDRYIDRLRGKEWHQNRGCRLSLLMLKDLVNSANLKVLDIKERAGNELWVYGRQKPAIM